MAFHLPMPVLYSVRGAAKTPDETVRTITEARYGAWAARPCERWPDAAAFWIIRKPAFDLAQMWKDALPAMWDRSVKRR
jgi:hypothetical protein